MKGRKPKPMALRALEGGRIRKRVKRNSLKPDPNLPPCPDHLDETATAMWHRYANELSRLGLLTLVDAPWFDELCFNISLSYQAQEKIKELGPVVEIYAEDEDGCLYVKEIRRNPWIMVEKQASERIVRIMSEAGMTPVSRSRVPQAKKPKPNSNPLEDWLKKKRVIQGGKK